MSNQANVTAEIFVSARLARCNLTRRAGYKSVRADHGFDASSLELLDRSTIRQTGGGSSSAFSSMAIMAIRSSRKPPMSVVETPLTDAYRMLAVIPASSAELSHSVLLSLA